MADKHKAVILYASAGHGHQKAAEGVLEAYREAVPSAKVHAYDTLLYAHTHFGRMYKQSYYFLIKHMPWLWGLFYYGTDFGWISPIVKGVRRFVNSLVTRPLEELLVRENPDAVISAHFLSTEVASHLKRKKRISSKIITVVTDYLPHNVWVGSEVSAYAVALEETKLELMRRGVPREIIHVSGIPVEKKFLKKHDRARVCENLEIRADLFTILITSGGAGIGHIQKIADGLLAMDRPVQVLVVCGTNAKLHDDMVQRGLENPLLRAYGFVNNMDELMAASDVVIGKAGGLTLTEAFVSGIPVILFRSVPGQETRNAGVVRDHGAGFVANSPVRVVQKVVDLLEEEPAMNRLREKVRRIARAEAARGIVELARHGV